jgi:hypothetical protein
LVVLLLQAAPAKLTVVGVVPFFKLGSAATTRSSNLLWHGEGRTRRGAARLVVVVVGLSLVAGAGGRRSRRGRRCWCCGGPGPGRVEQEGDGQPTAAHQAAAVGLVVIGLAAGLRGLAVLGEGRRVVA